MKLQSVIKRVLIYGSIALFLNYGGIPLSSWLYQDKVRDIENKRIQKVCNIEDYIPKIKKVESNDALHYLKIAHAISSKSLSTPLNFKAVKDLRGKKYEGKLQGPTEKKAAFEGVADCVYFSVFTYSNFNYLCDKLGKPELKKDVRYCEGKVEKQEWDHAWLQYRKDGKWHDFNAVMDFFSKDSKLDFDSFKPGDFLYDQEKSYTTYFVDSEEGKLKGRMNFESILKGKSNILKDIIKHIFT